MGLCVLASSLSASRGWAGCRIIPFLPASVSSLCFVFLVLAKQLVGSPSYDSDLLKRFWTHLGQIRTRGFFHLCELLVVLRSTSAEAEYRAQEYLCRFAHLFGSTGSSMSFLRQLGIQTMSWHTQAQARPHLCLTLGSLCETAEGTLGRWRDVWKTGGREPSVSVFLGKIPPPKVSSILNSVCVLKT